MFSFSIDDGNEIKCSTLREILNILTRKLKYITNESRYSTKREIFEDYHDIFFIIHNESTNTIEKFSIDVYLDIKDSNGKNVDINAFLEKYNYPREIYDKDIADYEEELKFQVTQLDRHQITSFSVDVIKYGDVIHSDVFQTKKQLITYLFKNIVNIHGIDLYSLWDLWKKVVEIVFNDIIIKINYQDKEIIFTLQMPTKDSPLFMLFDSDYNILSLEDFLDKFYINDETDKYTIEDFIRQKEDFIGTLTNHLHDLEASHNIYYPEEDWYTEGYLDDSLQWHRQS